MNPIRRAYRRATASLKAFAMRWSSGSPWAWGTASRTRYDYAGQVDAGASSLVTAVTLWLARTLPEAPIRVQRRVAGGALETREDHPLTALLARPNPYYSGLLLWQATIADWMVTGNAYWLKVRSGAGRPVELWWVPARAMTPRFPDDGSRFLDYWEYNPGGAPVRVEPAEVVHFRYGLDPANPRLGLSPLAALARELFTDEEAALWTASLLRNGVVPTVVVSPDDDVEVTQAVADETKAKIQSTIGGDNRGAPIVMAGKTKVTVLSWSPEQMNLRSLRQIPEERVAAVLGIPAIVVGFGAGLARSTFANMAEAREAAYEGTVIPTHRLFAAELQTQLLPDLGAEATEVVDFDTSQVRVLQPDLDKLHERLDRAVRGGWMTPNEARSRVDLDALPGGDVVYVPVGVVPTDPAELIAPVVEPDALPEPSPLRALPQPAKGSPGGVRVTTGEASGKWYHEITQDGDVFGYEELKHRVAHKGSARNLADALTRVRARHQAAAERDLASFLDQQRARVIGALNRQEKAIALADLFDAVSEARNLGRLLEKWYRRILGGVHELTQDALGVSFDLDDPTTRAYLAAAGVNIRGITETTRQAIAAALQAGQEAGEGIPQLAARIEALTDFNRARATLVSRTELGHASNTAAMATYRASGVVVGVEIFDGDGCGLRSHDDAEKAHGKRFRLDQMADIPTLAHPACVRAFGAIVDAGEIEAVA